MENLKRFCPHLPSGAAQGAESAGGYLEVLVTNRWASALLDCPTAKIVLRDWMRKWMSITGEDGARVVATRSGRIVAEGVTTERGSMIVAGDDTCY